MKFKDRTDHLPVLGVRVVATLRSSEGEQLGGWVRRAPEGLAMFVSHPRMCLHAVLPL